MSAKRDFYYMKYSTIKKNKNAIVFYKKIDNLLKIKVKNREFLFRGRKAPKMQPPPQPPH